MLGDGPHRARRALTTVFVLQAVVAWFISLPVQAAMYIRSGWSALAFVGAAVWLVGVFFETVGDAQMGAFRRNPANKGTVMDRGLWRYTRHPNYFGDATVWAGLYLIAAEHWIGALTIASPVLMAWFLSFKTGKPLLEKQMAETKPGVRRLHQANQRVLPAPAEVVRVTESASNGPPADQPDCYRPGVTELLDETVRSRQPAGRAGESRRVVHGD